MIQLHIYIYPFFSTFFSHIGYYRILSRVLCVILYVFIYLMYGSVYMSEKAMATHSSTLAWKIPWTDEPGRLQSMGLQRVGHDLASSLSLSCIGEGNGNPLQCSCLENPRDREAWWAVVYGVAQSLTWLEQLSSSSRGTQRILSLGFSIGWPFGCV